MKNKNTGIPINQEKIQQYLKDIRRIKVMTPQREKELAEMMKSGTLTDAQRDKVHKELLEGNLRFVITVAKQYQNQGLDFPDLIAEGNFGLMKAIKNFDWHKDLRFISYAVWWVKQSILQSLNDNARTIRLPVNVVQDLHRAKKAIESNGGSLEPKFQGLPSMIDLDMNINEEGDTLFDIIKNEDADRLLWYLWHTKNLGGYWWRFQSYKRKGETNKRKGLTKIEERQFGIIRLYVKKQKPSIYYDRRFFTFIEKYYEKSY